MGLLLLSKLLRNTLVHQRITTTRLGLFSRLRGVGLGRYLVLGLLDAGDRLVALKHGFASFLDQMREVVLLASLIYWLRTTTSAGTVQVLCIVGNAVWG